MKLRALLAALFVAGLAVSVAVAAPAEKGKGRTGTTAAETSTSGSGATTTGDAPRGHKGKGKKKGHGKKAECRPNRAAVLVGDFAAAGDASFAMSVKGGNKVGKQLAGKQVTVSVGPATKIRRSGKAMLADLKAGDLLLVQGRACKLDAQALTLVANKVVVLSPSDDEDESTTSTSTTTEPTSTTESTSTSTTGS